MLGERFEREIREQPQAWRRLAESNCAAAFAAAAGDGEVVLVGSGSSLFVAMLGAQALRRRGIAASALAATEATFERGGYDGRSVIALSQSGRSGDVLTAVERLAPARLVVLTNDAASPLAARADAVIDIGAGPERAIPATKSVTGMAAVVLWGASLAGGSATRDAAGLQQLAGSLERWLNDAAAYRCLVRAAERLARRRSAIVIGAGYGVPVALEIALKLKEASYLHAEGFAAGEFRHGSAAILDATTSLLGIVDRASRESVSRPFGEAMQTETLRFTIGGELDGVVALGLPALGEFDVLAWLVAGQVLALEVGRARGIDGDAPRGLAKFVT